MNLYQYDPATLKWVGQFWIPFYRLIRSVCIIQLILICGIAQLSAAYNMWDFVQVKPKMEKSWNAFWITHDPTTGKDYGIYYFRKSIDLSVPPNHFIVKVSADNRYKLYVNGTLVSVGPARGDIFYWNYETLDLSPYLKVGKNSISAVVWNDGAYKPEAQISLQTGFILQGNSPDEEVLNTGKGWKTFQDQAYSPITDLGYPTYYVADPGERVDMNKTVKNWMKGDFNDSSWTQAKIIESGKPKGFPDASGWMLVPSTLPQMERTVQRIPVLRKAAGVHVPGAFPSKKTMVTIPPNTIATLLLDQTYLTNAYLTLNFSNGKDAQISLTYAESLFDNLAKYGTKKSNRNVVEGKDFAGRKDSIISNGTSGQSFNTLYWRTYRYIEIKVTTKEMPLIIDDLYGTFTGYPFQLNAKLKTNSPEIHKILDIGWRTARLDAIETYMDCPYYEQLQYIGDTRIQALVSYYNSGDIRLINNAINQMDHSLNAEGLTSSRHPSFTPQFIPTFSLWYIGILHDYWMYTPDSSLIKEKLTGERAILNFFSKYQQSDGSLKDIPYWNFVDWAENKNWIKGIPPLGKNGGSSILDLQLLLAYQMAADLESKLGMPAYAELYQTKVKQLAGTIKIKYWDTYRGLFADTEEKDVFSQHANSLALLTGLVNTEEQVAVGKKLLNDQTLTQCTIYFKYYLHQALIQAGLGNDYLSWLSIWRENIKNGLTTWAEISDLEQTRSDCHAWGSSPNIEFYRTVLGINSDAPGFRKVKIEPHLGNLSKQDVEGEMPHPNGKIIVKYQYKSGIRTIHINLPKNISGIFIWKDKSYAIHEGENNFKGNDDSLI